MMEFAMLGLLAETPLHPGAGQDAGFVDVPVAREAVTEHPVIVGSSLKGALKEHCAGAEKLDDSAFGNTDAAGDLVICDAKLTLLPVRSLSSAYMWVTCPLILERLGRDLNRSGLGRAPAETPTVERKRYLGPKSLGDTLFLEERQFQHADGDLSPWLEILRRLIAYETTRNRLASQVAVLNDQDFKWFAKYGLTVNARNQLDDKKTSKNLWYEETIPVDALLTTLIGDRRGNVLSALIEHLKTTGYLQAGGNETVGQGWMAVQPLVGREVVS